MQILGWLLHNHSETGTLRFEFDHVFDKDTTQEAIFELTFRDKVKDALDGINSTIFAYGQTGAGKTFSICGGNSFEDRGLIPRAIGCIFDEIRERQQQQRASVFKCQISFTEVYKETLYDLLDQSKRSQPIETWDPVQLFEGENGLVLKNINVFEVETEEAALSLFFMGTSNRITSSSQMNDASSRSHAIFSITIESEGIRDDKTILTSGKMNFVDLAGSERMYKMINTKGQINEAKGINLSLHYLEQVIVCLRDQNNYQHQLQARVAARNTTSVGPAIVSTGQHIPYRNSVLTNLLRDSLGGNCKSCFLLLLSAERLHFEESISTCRFGQRCGEVKVNVHANTEVGLSDQLKELSIRVKLMERHIHNLEEQKQQFEADLQHEREMRIYHCEPRDITAEESSACDLFVQRVKTVTPDHAQFLNLNFAAVEGMDKAALMDLALTLGDAVQQLCLEKQQAKSEECQRAERLKADTEARMRQEEAQRLRALQQAAAAAAAITATPAEVAGIPGLSEQTSKVLVTGAAFIKHSSMGWKRHRYIWLTPDLKNICWRQIGNMQSQTTMALADFISVDVDRPDKKLKGKESCLISLTGRQGVKSLHIEYAMKETIEENKAEASLWADGLKKCLKRAIELQPPANAISAV